MRVRDAQGGAAKQQLIINEVVAMLGHRRASSVTTKTLAERLKISEAALYRYFPSKRAIYTALVVRCEAALVPCFQAPQSNKTPHEACEHFFSELIAFFDKNPGLVRFLTREVLHPEYPALEDRMRKILSELRLAVRQQLSELPDPSASLHGMKPSDSAAAMVSAADGVLAQWAHEGFQLPLQDSWTPVWTYLKPKA